MKYIGTYTLCNSGGLAIVSIDPASNTCYSCFDFGNGPENGRRTKIYYASSGRAYIRRYGHRYYMDEIMRVGV